MHKRSLFSTASPVLVVSCLSDDDHSNRCEVISYYGFDLHFPGDKGYQAPFNVHFGHLSYSNVLFENFIKFLCYFSIIFFAIEFTYFDNNTLSDNMIYIYFLPICRLPFHFINGFLCCTEAF